MIGENVEEVRGDLSSWLVGEVVQSLGGLGCWFSSRRCMRERCELCVEAP